MQATAEITTPLVEKQGILVKKRPKIPTSMRKMSLERFLNWKPTDGYKYDWTSGYATIYKKMVSETQRYIVRNILRAFTKTTAYTQGGDLFAEVQMSYHTDKYRIPDVAYFTREQTKAAAIGEHTISSFVIEILSDTDSQKTVESKLWEYFEHGVQVVWQVLPYLQVVKVYTSPRQVQILWKDDVCSASPALEGFEMTVAEVFAL